MPLVALTLDFARQALEQARDAGCESRRVMSLGYPDPLVRPEHVQQILGAAAAGVRWREDSAAILGWHRAAGLTDRVADAYSLFAALGYELDVLDIHAARGGELVYDLNAPLPDSLHRRYAMVLDTGTLEHCFNIGQAAVNIASMVAEHGAVMHGNPLNMYNHGFYNLNPTWYHDFYEQNGFVVEFLAVVNDVLTDAPRLGEVPAYQRFRSAPENSTLLAIVRRAELRVLSWPVQKKYRDNPDLRG